MEEKITNKENYREVNLSIPIEIEKDGKVTVIDKLKLGRIKLKALKNLPSNTLSADGMTSPESIIPLIAASANVPVEIIEEIDMIDINRVTEALDPFLPQAPQTGEK